MSSLLLLPLCAALTIVAGQRKALADVPNALGFQRIIETETNGYLVRQFMYSSLYDRLSTRPFLEDIEKKWLAFQLLCAMRDCHARDVYHGDIKAQNILVTSWNWLYLTDFSSTYKPVMLPDDNPGDFSYFFDTSGRRTCYIAPERFYPSGDTPPQDAQMTWAMDIFSAGCVIAQMFLESEVFSLAQLYKYRRGEYDPVITHLGVISDKDVRDMISHMMQLDPERRYSADQYLTFWKDKVFPAYFYNFLHQYMWLITDPSSGNSPMSGTHKNMGESDDRIDRVYYDFDKIAYFLGHHAEKSYSVVDQTITRLGLSQLPVRLSIPSYEHTVSADLEPPEDDGTLIFLTLVVSSMRTTAHASSRIKACDILLAFSERLTDEAKLDRLLPYLMTLLRKEEPDIVIMSAIRTITQLLQLVSTVTPINSHVFVEYVLPRMEIALGSKSRRTSPLVRATYASCLGSLATSAQRFLEVASSLRTEGSVSITDSEIEPGTDAEANFESVFDISGRQLFEVVENHTKQLVEDPDVHVRQAFLHSVPELCMFFQEHSNDVLLTHLNTYLNDRDWTLKCAFFDTIVAISTFIGSTTLEEFMLPLMIQALMDTEEFVVQAALHSLAQLAGLGLLSRPKVWELTNLVSRFTMHPNIWIREASAEFLSMSARFLEAADVTCILMPLTKPYLKVSNLPNFDEVDILDSLKRPLPRAVFEQAVTWALKTDRGVFWKSLRQLQSSSFGSVAASASQPSRDLMPTSMSKVPRNDEDEQWLAKLRNLGLKPDDEPKLLALREFIWRLSRMKKAQERDSSGEPNVAATGMVFLKELGVTPQTVFFHDAPLRDPDSRAELEAEAGFYTIADALLDASMSIDDSFGKRRRAQKGRVQSVGPWRTQQTGRLLSPGDGGGDALKEHRRASSAARVVGTDQEDASVKEGSYSLRRPVRHQSSALSLLDRKDGNKSIAETGMSEANAFGEVEGAFAPSGPARSTSSTGMTSEIAPATRSKHSYEGTDPNVKKMLDNMFIDNFPRDVVEFGSIVPAISRNKARAVSAQAGENSWRPQGHIVATFWEHKGSINKVAASPDHVFFVTGGNDACVKVWDTARLERNITHRSRQTHKHADGSRVKALCFIENSHCFVSCADDGSVNVVKVDTAQASGVVRYGKLRLLREYQLPEGEFAVWCEHFRQESNSVLIIATNRSRILGIDLRLMTLLYMLENPAHHGTPTCFCVDRKRHWLVVGTSHGVVDLWDLRFKTRLKGWGVPGEGPIYNICIHPTRGRGKWICISGGTGQGEITVWDLEKTICREIYRTSGSKDGADWYEAWEVDQDKPESMLGRFATILDKSVNADRHVRAMVAGTGSAEDARDLRHAFFITGGSDKKLRFWDVSRIENSLIFSGLQPEEPLPTYTSSHPTTNTALYMERVPRYAPTAPNAGSGAVKGAKAKSGGRTPRSTVISQQQQQLLRSHLDAIQDVVLLEYPYTMCVSVDRSGVVFVFR